MAKQPDSKWAQAITARDEKVAAKVQIVSNPGFFIGLGSKIVRLGERETVAEKIEILHG